ncbi:MAG: hypothetical protein KDK39_13500 [Leptospiraceae bacterium]|nr:hypothetical protein [Leptospiraceae bacterium]
MLPILSFRPARTSSRFYCTLLLISALLSAGPGCKDDRAIHVYRTAKSANLQKESGSAGLGWNMPAGWSVRDGDAMRLASFSAPGPAGEADVSIVRLAGDGGGLAANINRWRGQIQLAPLAENTILNQMQREQGKLGVFKWIQLTNPGLGSNAIYGAVLQSKRGVVFVKMNGSLETLRANQEYFLQLCRSITEKTTSQSSNP